MQTRPAQLLKNEQQAAGTELSVAEASLLFSNKQENSTRTREPGFGSSLLQQRLGAAEVSPQNDTSPPHRHRSETARQAERD